MLWRATTGDRFEERFITRFDPRFWTVNFPRPMMAAVTNPGGDALDVTLVFYAKDDLAGLIWESEDTLDHPLLGYATNRDYRGLVFSFRWLSQGLKTLPEVNGPTLTIEGRDQTGAPRTWFVRLWNYAVGTAEDAVITLDFDNLDGGFLLPAEADPVWAGDIDRLFISMVPPEFDGVASGPLSGGRVEATLSLSAMRTRGGNAALAIGDDYMKPHETRLANGYDDSFNITPARLVRNLLHLGYRDWLTHYVGMSHYYSVAWDADEARYIVDPALPVLNVATVAWHSDLFARLARFGFRLALSLSFELLAQNAPADWSQRAFDGAQALTAWVPPSTLLQPTNTTAMGYLKSVYQAFGDLMVAAGLPPIFQIGEPWWWVSLDAAAVPHFYDATTTALFTAETGLPLPPMHQSASETPSAEQQVYLDWLGAKLGAATLDLRDFLRTTYANAQVTLLFFVPQVLNAAQPMRETVNFPVASWAWPAFDFLQIEDYTHVINADWRAHALGLEKVAADLGYPLSATQFFAGFVLDPADTQIWANIARALEDARARGFVERVIWAYPQTVRDGVVVFDPLEEPDMSGFHEVRLPATISFGSRGGPRFSTEIVVTASGHERRNQDWLEARAEYDLAGGIRSEADLATLVAFFRARAGRAFGFRFKDWADYSSAAPGAAISATDQAIGSGDGTTTAFQLVKAYGDGAATHLRTIRKPVAGTVRVALDGTEQTSGWSLDDTTGLVSFTTPPAAGVAITAGFEFDVPVRFAEDRIAVSLEAFAAGEVPSIRLLEIRE
ncbi:MAG: TIGR02217 family protein [Alphaproteobacteria bacterium]|nr:MAG: TIGR02217 family protein [Alphaproteobacteria bacterium]